VLATECFFFIQPLGWGPPSYILDEGLRSAEVLASRFGLRATFGPFAMETVQKCSSPGGCNFASSPAAGAGKSVTVIYIGRLRGGRWCFLKRAQGGGTASGRPSNSPHPGPLVKIFFSSFPFQRNP